MAKYKSKIKDNKIRIRAKLSRKETINEVELEYFIREHNSKNIRGLFRVKKLRGRKLEYYGPEGISLSAIFARPVCKRDFFFYINLILKFSREMNAYALPMNKIVLDLHQIYYNTVTQELRFIYLPIEMMKGEADFIGLMEQVAYVQVSNIINGVPADTLMNILLNLIGAVIEVRNNGFLSFQNIDMEWHRVYVDMNTLKVKLAYVPVNYPLYNNYPEFENDLKSEMIKLVNSVSARGASSEKFEKFVWGLSSGKLSLVDVYNQLKVGGMQPVHKYPDPIDPPDPGPNPDPDIWRGIPLPPLEPPKSFLSLVLINGMQPVTITLSRECTVIGKKRELVDECITFNNMISRKHCSIVRQGDKYFITDEASSNGTFVNGSRLVPKQYYQINKGDVIRMADADENYYSNDYGEDDYATGIAAAALDLYYLSGEKCEVHYNARVAYNGEIISFNIVSIDKIEQ